MTQAPESIWIDRGPNGGWMFRTEKLHDSVRQYVPTDALAARDARIAALEAEVEKAANVFADYAEMHSAKGTEEGRAKARKNAALSAELRAALAQEREHG